MPSLRLTGGIALVVASVAGCGAVTSPAAEGPLPSEPTMIDYVSPARVRGLDVRTVSRRDPGGPEMHAAYPAVADAPRLTEELRRTVTERLGLFDRSVRASRKGTAGQPPRGEFNVGWQFAAASGEVLGVRLRTGESAGGGWTESRTTLWYDRVDKRAMGSAALLRDRAALTELARLARRSLLARGAAVNPQAVTPDPKIFDSIAFNMHGDLVVEFDDSQVGPAFLGRVAVYVPAGTAGPMLSPTGLRAQRAAVEEAESRAAPPPVSALKEANDGRPDAVSSGGGVDCARTKCVALTYDDGPGAGTTGVLDALAAQGARATFFCVGSSAVARPDLLRRMTAEGHLVAGHTWSHRDLTTLSRNMITDQLVRGRDAVAQASGQVPTLVRPPYGKVGDQVTAVARELGMPVVRWSVDTGDLKDPTPADVAARAVAGAARGAIILMHDTGRSTAEATAEVLRRLRAEGYTFVTVPELYGSHGMRPGAVHDSAESGDRARALARQTML
ncbi:polysaccharide deacetylase family protein [Streptosporangium sp. NPDC004379]|uniref:polysaccharide deacetylase family protein n=1 Tax=Streptosporangium sp. NPDC004379 TaxID=3366189 RepID=UPI0036835867